MYNYKNWSGVPWLGLIFIIICFNACRLVECAPAYTATVVDDFSNEPIEGVTVNFFGGGEGNGQTFTDEEGKFFVVYETNQPLFLWKKCNVRPVRLEIIQPGYDTLSFTTTRKNDRETLRLTR